MRVNVVVVGLLVLGSLLFAAGCRTYVTQEGLTLPSPRYLEQPPQYVTPAGIQAKPLPAAQLPSPALPYPPTSSSGPPFTPASGVPMAPKSPPQGTVSTGFISTTLMSRSAPAVPRSAQVKLAALEDFALKEGRLTFNNFCLAEAAGQQVATGQAHIKVRGCFRNGDANPATFVLVVVGVDEAGEVLWAGNVSGSATGNDVGCLREVTVPVLPGTLRQTAGVRLRANVAPLHPTPQGTTSNFRWDPSRPNVFP